MAYVIAVPEMMTAAAADLATIAENVNAAHMVAAPPTVAVLPAAADEVSAGIAHLFSGYGQEYQKLAGQAVASYEQFTQHLTASAGAYAGAEDVIAGFLQDWANLLSASTTALLTDPALSPLRTLLFELLLLTVFATIPPLLVVTVIPVLAVALPILFAVGLPISIIGLAAAFGPVILFGLIAQLGAAL